MVLFCFCFNFSAQTPEETKKAQEMSEGKIRTSCILGLYSLTELLTEVLSGISSTPLQLFRQDFSTIVDEEKGRSNEFARAFGAYEKTREGEFDFKGALRDFDVRVF